MKDKAATIRYNIETAERVKRLAQRTAYNGRLKSHFCPEWDGLYVRPEDPEFDACLCFYNEDQPPAAYAVFCDNGNIRIWSADPVQVEKLKAEWGDRLKPLYTERAHT